VHFFSGTDLFFFQHFQYIVNTAVKVMWGSLSIAHYSESNIGGVVGVASLWGGWYIDIDDSGTCRDGAIISVNG